MRTVKRSLPVRWLLLAVLIFALAVMHHLAAQHDGGSCSHRTTSETITMMGPEPLATAVADAPSAHPMSDAGGMASMLHQCLAVVGQLGIGVLLLLLLVGLACLLAESFPQIRRATARAPDPPPWRGGRTILASLCVLRL